MKGAQCVDSSGEGSAATQASVQLRLRSEFSFNSGPSSAERASPDGRAGVGRGASRRSDLQHGPSLEGEAPWASELALSVSRLRLNVPNGTASAGIGVERSLASMSSSKSESVFLAAVAKTLD
jgi:hypothetical protein